MQQTIVRDLKWPRLSYELFDLYPVNGVTPVILFTRADVDNGDLYAGLLADRRSIVFVLIPDPDDIVLGELDELCTMSLDNRITVQPEVIETEDCIWCAAYDPLHKIIYVL